VVEPTTGAERLRLLKGLILPIMVVVFVLGSLYAGVASVPEASAVGLAGVALSAEIRGEFTWTFLRESAIQTLAACGMIVWTGSLGHHDRLPRHRGGLIGGRRPFRLPIRDAGSMCRKATEPPARTPGRRKMRRLFHLIPWWA
jgi:hypothetical protein